MVLCFMYLWHEAKSFFFVFCFTKTLPATEMAVGLSVSGAAIWACPKTCSTTVLQSAFKMKNQ